MGASKALNWIGWSAPLLALSALLTSPSESSAQNTQLVSLDRTGEVTFTKDVAAIIQQNCQVCHQPGGIGPMPLMTFDQVKAFAPLIKSKVVAREMPPYAYDTDVGIQQLKQDWRLSDAEIRTIAAWVDAGAPMGDPAHMPPPVTWPAPGEFRMSAEFGPPDLVIKSAPYTVPAQGQDIWWRPVVPTGLTEDRCIKAIETKPSLAARGIAHHANSSFRVGGRGDAATGGGTRLSEYAMGKLGEVIPDGACRVAPANSEVSWDVHYYPSGVEVVDDQVEIGIWLHPKGYEQQAKYRQTLSLYSLQGGRGFDIPPHGTLMTQGFHTFQTPVRIDSFQPHGHLRMVAKSLQILRKNGRLEMVSMVSNWSPMWHHSHIYEDNVAPLLEVGDFLVITAWYDNTENNHHNPDPDQWVGVGDRTADEMSHAWIAVTHLDEEEYKRLLATRQTQARPATEQQSGASPGGPAQPPR
jgi:mono/diheme cytochrome c family protein